MNKLLSGTFFKTKLGREYGLYSVTTMATFRQYKTLLPAEVRYLVVGCLPTLMVELCVSKVEPREVTLSKYGDDYTLLPALLSSIGWLIFRPDDD